jgi:hypothetical protein
MAQKLCKDTHYYINKRKKKYLFLFFFILVSMVLACRFFFFIFAAIKGLGFEKREWKDRETEGKVDPETINM